MPRIRKVELIHLYAVFHGSYKTLPLFWLIPIAFGVLILAWASLRVLWLRKSLAASAVKAPSGLKMHPTFRTIRNSLQAW